jgi:hypothetical protein
MKILVNIDGMKGSSQNLKDQSKTIQVFLGWGSRVSHLPGFSPGPKHPVSRKYIFSVSFCHTGMQHTLFKTSGLGIIKSRELNFEFW